MPYLNSVTLMGHLGQDPQLRYSPAGKPVAQFSVAINIRDRESGESHGEFFPCEVWGGWAENLCKTAKKGALVVISGRLKQETWRDKDTGDNRSRVKVVARQAIHVVAQYEGKEEEEEQAF